MEKMILQLAKRRSRFLGVFCIALLAAIALFAACERPEPESESEPEPPAQLEFSWEDVTDSIPCLLLSMNSITLVNDNSTLLNLCPDAPTFDFSNHSLLIVSGVSPNEIDSLGVNFEQVNNMQYLLTIHIVTFYTACPEGWHKYILIPKVTSVNDIQLSIYYNDQYPLSSNELFVGEWE